MSNNSEPKNLMKTFLVLVCSVALACTASAAKNENKSKKAAPPKRQAQPTQHATAARGPNRPTPKHYEAASRTANYQNTKGPQRRENIQGAAFQSGIEHPSDQICVREVPAKQTNLGKPKLARQKLLGFSELQACVA